MNTSELLIGRRPTIVTWQNREAYANASMEQEPGTGSYGYFGEQASYTWPLSGASTAELLCDGMNLLDLGCATGEVVRDFANRAKRNRAIGITAFDYSAGANPFIRVGDMHDLQFLIARHEAPFQAIVERRALMHTNDPFSIVEQALNLVDKDGLALLDTFDLTFDNNARVPNEVISYLVKSGHFAILGTNAADIKERAAYGNFFFKHFSAGHEFRMPQMMLKRCSSPNQPVVLPVDYACAQAESNSKGWRYIVA